MSFTVLDYGAQTDQLPSSFAFHKGQSSVAYRQFTSLEITSTGITPKTVPVNITSRYKDYTTSQTTGMNSANVYLQTNIRNHMTELSRHSGRTLDPSGYNRYTDALLEHGNPILNLNSGNDATLMRNKLFRQHQRFWLGMVNCILALDDAAHFQDFVDRKLKDIDGPPSAQQLEEIYHQASTLLTEHPEVNAPILIVGNPTFGPQQRRRGTFSSPKKFIQIMARFFYLVIVDEYMSSQVGIQSPEFCSLYC